MSDEGSCGSSPPLVFIQTVDEVQEAATILLRPADRQVRESHGQVFRQKGVTHHLKVPVPDVAESFADVTAGKPLTGPEWPLLPGRQATQSF